LPARAAGQCGWRRYDLDEAYGAAAVTEMFDDVYAWLRLAAEEQEEYVAILSRERGDIFRRALEPTP
jgi:hypothetical protein